MKKKIPNFFFLILLLLSFTSQIHSSQHFIKPPTKKPNNYADDVTPPPQEYFQVTHSLPTDNLVPSCTINSLTHSFENTYNTPPVTVPYTPPPTSCLWSHAVLNFHVEIAGEQYDRIAGVWMNGVEILRTSTAQPTENGIFWNVRKDVSKYTSILSEDDVTLSVMLENIVNDEFTGIYHVNVTFEFYDMNRNGNYNNNNNAGLFPLSMVTKRNKMKEISNLKNRKVLYSVENDYNNLINNLNKPADLIVPVSLANGEEEGYWFRIQNESDVMETDIGIDKRTYKAVLEVYVSFHGNDEFWYMNPSDSYVEVNNLDTGRAHGAYREVLVTIDGQLVGGVVPFPVIFTGGINPLFWEPVVSIGAFDLPSYDIDITPFLGLLLDGKKHSIGLQVADGISFWLVDANLHMWFDSKDVKAEIVKSKVPAMEIERKYEFERLDGEFEIEGEREIVVISWVNSTMGNLSTELNLKSKFKNKIKYKDQGAKKELDHSYKKKTKVKTTDEFGNVVGKTKVKIDYPLTVETETLPGPEQGTSVMTTKLEQERSEKVSDDKDTTGLSHKQSCDGTMVVKGKEVLSGSADNHQDYEYTDGLVCYSRKVDVLNGTIVTDVTSSNCNMFY
uniref:peptide-N4-(N-acetyl-beta- glucosaminyl)asparagine amidase A n=1 Tax=Erigeron canadensis TaxID=72917 RepID=UPI001CB980A2|nr:peptide-N4-(N-acetyl-beta-glucosaminyl)asparagine amidase A [Erigeron canadensis]